MDTRLGTANALWLPGCVSAWTELHGGGMAAGAQRWGSCWPLQPCVLAAQASTHACYQATPKTRCITKCWNPDFGPQRMSPHDRPMQDP